MQKRNPETKNPILLLRMGFFSIPKHALASKGFKRRFMLSYQALYQQNNFSIQTFNPSCQANNG
jgi:hypothetical protein